MPTFAHGHWFLSVDDYHVQFALQEMLSIHEPLWQQFTLKRDGDTFVVGVPREWAKRISRRLNQDVDGDGAFELLWGIGRMRIVLPDALSVENGAVA